MTHMRYWLAFIMLWPALLSGINPPDNSKASPDGPYVFYRGGKTIVKYVERGDTGMVSRSTVYEKRSSVLLTCAIPEKGDRFSFELRDTLTVEPDQYPLPGKMLVLSDIEGNFQAFKTMLLGARVIDRDFKWTMGDGHLVLLGDYFDRGLNVTECLWLIYKLETEAKAAGGKVHFILGNHEVLNLQGNTEYTRNKYIANAQLIGEPYKLWFDTYSELGRWLRTKNAVEKIGDYVFCHGGISPELVRTKLSLSDINRIARQYLGKPYESLPNGHPKSIFDVRTGIFWYREGVKNMLSIETMTEALNFVGAQRMIVGHTLVPDLTAQYGGRLISIDLYHEENLRRGFMKTLWIEQGFCYGIDSRGEKTSVFSIVYPKKKEN